MNLRPDLDEDAIESIADVIDPQAAGCGSFEAMASVTPRQAMDLAWLALRSLNTEDFLSATLEVERLIAQGHALREPAYRDEVQTLAALHQLWRDDFEKTIALACDVLERPAAARFHYMLTSVLRLAYWRTRRLQPFYDLSRQSAQRHPATSFLWEVINISAEAAAEAEQLRFKHAERLAKDAMALSGVHGGDPTLSLLPVGVLASIAYEAGAVKEADQLIRGRTLPLEQCCSSDSALLGFTVCANVALAQGNLGLALSILKRARDLGIRRGWRRLLARAMADEAIVHVTQRRLDLAYALMAKATEHFPIAHDASDASRLDTWPLELARSRIAIAEGKWELAAQTISRLRNFLSRHQYAAVVLQLDAWLAGVLFSDGRTEEGAAQLLEALRVGADVGLFRSFVDAMPVIEPCLLHLRASTGGSLGHLLPYSASLLTASSASTKEKGKAGPSQDAMAALSPREALILRLISLGHSNKSIARELHIAPETVKSHAKRIFIKLSSKTRAEAVARGNELGII